MYFFFFFFFNDTATTEIYTSSHTLSLHDALPICRRRTHRAGHEPEAPALAREGRSGAARSEEHTSELQLRELISYAVFCLKKKKKKGQRPMSRGPEKPHTISEILSSS